jgi:serine/threonine protein kinase
MKYKLIDHLGSGAGGDVYLVQDKRTSKKYALKNLAFDDYTEKYLSGEIEFNENVAKKYPNFFIQLKGYEISEDCSLYKKTYRSTPIKCIQKVYTLVDGQLCEIFEDLSEEAQMSASIQFLYILHIMIKEKLFQGDLNPGNIGYIRTTKKYINLNIGNKIHRLNTYGILVQLLDTDVILDLKGMSMEDIMHRMINFAYSEVYLNTLGITIKDAESYRSIEALLKEIIIF